MTPLFAATQTCYAAALRTLFALLFVTQLCTLRSRCGCVGREARPDKYGRLQSKTMVPAYRRRCSPASPSHSSGYPSRVPMMTPAAGLVSPSRNESWTVSYTHLRAHETRHDIVCRLLL